MTTPTVLVVDDDPDILSAMQDLFAVDLPGVRVLTSTSPKEALELCRREKPAVIVSDYKMPEMNGIEFLRKSIEVHPGATRLMMSAYADPDIAAQAVKEVDVAFLITKPFQLEYFIQLVAGLLKPSGSKGPG